MFEEIDRDNSGTLDKEELITAMETNSVLENGDPNTLISIMDTDKDGKIDMDEFLNAFRIVCRGFHPE